MYLLGLCVCAHATVCHYPSLRTTFGTFVFTIWYFGIKLRSSGLAASDFPHCLAGSQCYLCSVPYLIACLHLCQLFLQFLYVSYLFYFIFVFCFLCMCVDVLPCLLVCVHFTYIHVLTFTLIYYLLLLFVLGGANY